MKKDTHLVIISVDALNSEDFDYIQSLNHFKSFFDNGSVVQSVTTVYPSLTYTCHTSIITGTFPNKHGIFANEIPVPKLANEQPWHWYEKDIKVPTLFDYVNKAGMTCGNVLWPVMTDAPIKYNVPEIWSITGKSYTRELLSHTSIALWPTLLKHAGKAKGKKQPYLDNFIEACATDILLKKKPNLMTMHLIELDQERHETGLMDPRREMVLTRINQRIGRIIETTKKAGIYENTHFIVLGDHGGMNHDQVIYLNTYFKEEGFIQTDNNNQITQWDLYANECGGSAQILINPDIDPNKRQKAVDAIGRLTSMPGTFIQNTFDKETADEKYHLSGPFDFVLEAKEGYIFRTVLEDSVKKNRAQIKNSYRLEHGHNPNRTHMQTMFMAMGPTIKPKLLLESGHVTNIAPTAARMLGLEMIQTDGAIMDIFK